MNKFIVSIVLCIVVVTGITVGSNVGHENKQHQPTPVISSAPNTQGVLKNSSSVSIPLSLSIPKIGVNAVVEEVGLDSQSRMDVPKDSDNVAWYRLGYKPGEKGNAVMAGHLDKVSGEPAVFWQVASLVPGDKLIVSDANGKTYTFSVIKVSEYPYNDFPIQEVFGSSSKSMLNLITCQGEWNSQTNNYSHRVVVYSELVEE